MVPVRSGDGEVFAKFVLNKGHAYLINFHLSYIAYNNTQLSIPQPSTHTHTHTST